MMFNIDIHYKIQFKIHQTLVIQFIDQVPQYLIFRQIAVYCNACAVNLQYQCL